MTLLVIVLEATHAWQYVVRRERGRIGPASLTQLSQRSWDTPPHMTDQNGVRLVEEAVRRMRQIPASELRQPDAVAITTPGTIQGTSVIDGSTRLSITGAINVTEKFAELKAPPCHVFHDVEALALGEVRHGTPQLPDKPSEFAYILIDEGIGCAMFVNGKPYLGAGVAGHLGRLVVNPDGPYNEIFSQRGPLESYAARPWVSRRIIGEYRAEVGKNGAAGQGNSPFRAALRALSAKQETWQALAVEQIAEGLKDGDPIVGAVLEDAAKYLSMGINAVITIMNPKLLILGGAMIESMPGFAETVMSHCRRDAWAGAWNETTIHVATLSRNAQVLGAAEMLLDTLDGLPPR